MELNRKCAEKKRLRDQFIPRISSSLFPGSATEIPDMQGSTSSYWKIIIFATAAILAVWHGSIAFSAPLSSPSHTPPKIKTGTVTGRFVVQSGGSMSGGTVMLYNADTGPPPLIAQYKRVPTRIVGIDQDSAFQATMPVGTYYLAAVKRNSGRQFGKPLPGDYSFRYYKPDSLELDTLSINEGERIDLGTLEAHPWQEHRMDTRQSSTAIEGTLTDMEGRPIENALVFAFSTPRMQGNRPKFISEKTGKDGRYSLMIAGDATYYLMARDKMGGGQLQEGEIIGVYGTQKPVGVAIKTGETVKGIDFKVARMERRGPADTVGSGKEPDPTGQVSRNPSMLPSANPPGSLLEKKQPE